jgi:hypothetical protein
LKRSNKQKINKCKTVSPTSPPPAYDCSVTLISLPSTPIRASLPTPPPVPTQQNIDQLSYIRAYLADINNFETPLNEKSNSFLDIELD